MSLFMYVRRHAKAIIFTIVIFALSGAALTWVMPVSLFPDVTFPRIVVLADNGEQPVERMMIEVTKPLEEVASSIPGVRMVRSITGRGSTEISIGLEWGSNVQQTLQMLQGKIANIRNQLPAEASVQAEQMFVAVFPIQGYSLTSDKQSLVELRDIALYQIRPALLRVKGVAKVEIAGGDMREFLVTLSPEKLAAYHLNPEQVVEGINKTNVISSSGLVEDNYQLYLSVTSGLVRSIGDLESVVVSLQNGVPIRVADVASVKPSVADRYIRTTANGKDAVLITIIKQPTGSTVQISRDVAAEVKKLALPLDVSFENWYDQGDFINSSIAGTRDSIIIGVLLAMSVMLIFLRSWRVMVVILLVVPITIASTIVCLYAVGLSINIMTLGGIAAAVGLTIDDSIVVVENIFTQYAKRKRRDATHEEALADASSGSLRHMMPAIIGSSASTIVIQIPLAFLGGVTGAFFTSLSITMVFAMLISFLLSITLAPLLTALMLNQGDFEREVAKEDAESRIAQWYGRTCAALLRYRLAVIPAALAVMLMTYFLYGQIGSGFMPEMDEGTFVLDYKTPGGTSLSETNRILMKIEKILAAVPEVETYSRRTGLELGFFMTEPNSGDFLVKLKKKRSRGIEEVISEVRSKVEASEPSIEIEFGQMMMDVIGDLVNNPQPIEIKLFGEEPALLQAKANEVKALIETIPGVVDVFNGIVVSGPSFVVNIDPAKTWQAGFNPMDVHEQLETIIHGKTESNIQKGQKVIGIRVRYPDIYRNDVDRIEGLQLINSNNLPVPLRSIASFKKTVGQTEIRREGLRELIAVTARISGRDMGSTVNDIKAKLSANLILPRGVSLDYGGIYQTQQESFLGLLMVALAAFMLVFVVLLFEFGEFTVPLSIFVINVLSLFGVFGALWLSGVTFNISSFVGVIMIIGIVAENAIFVLHSVKSFRAEGRSLDDAIIKAGQVRARPILMTTLAAVFALLPLALGTGSGAQMQQSLAIAVIGGFSVSSLLLFFGLPMVYRLMKS
ncbi:MAG: efflux RND transporter permease subunit [Ignavibacteriales bacterium]|nr:efflux RND transporter permease subunit [Ignavibacteriales bacterium]